MAPPVKVLSVSAADRQELERRLRSQTLPAGAARRARIVLLASQGVPGAQIAELVGCSEPTVIGWRRRYRQSGLRGLEDRGRSGRPRSVVDDAKEHEVLAATLKSPPAALGVSHWSARLLARQVGLHFTLGRGDLAVVGHPALAVRDVQVLYRPAARGQDRRRGRGCT